MDSSEQKMLLYAAQTWDNIIFYGGEMKDGTGTSHFEINMKDKSTNSLKQLYTFMGKMAAEDRKRKPILKDEEVEMPPPLIDSTKLYTPPVVKPDN